MKLNRTRIIIISLVVVTTLLAGAAIFIGWRLQNQINTPSSAANQGKCINSKGYKLLITINGKDLGDMYQKLYGIENTNERQVIVFKLVDQSGNKVNMDGYIAKVYFDNKYVEDDDIISRVKLVDGEYILDVSIFEFPSNGFVTREFKLDENNCLYTYEKQTYDNSENALKAYEDTKKNHPRFVVEGIKYTLVPSSPKIGEKVKLTIDRSGVSPCSSSNNFDNVLAYYDKSVTGPSNSYLSGLKIVSPNTYEVSFTALGKTNVIIFSTNDIKCVANPFVFNATETSTNSVGNVSSSDIPQCIGMTVGKNGGVESQGGLVTLNSNESINITFKLKGLNATDERGFSIFNRQNLNSTKDSWIKTSYNTENTTGTQKKVGTLVGSEIHYKFSVPYSYLFRPDTSALVNPAPSNDNKAAGTQWASGQVPNALQLNGIVQYATGAYDPSCVVYVNKGTTVVASTSSSSSISAQSSSSSSSSSSLSSSSTTSSGGGTLPSTDLSRMNIFAVVIGISTFFMGFVLLKRKRDLEY